ncbi:MAG TPA: ferritin-like protein [Blastocatellia bacterium]|nr:ferritin-like protein [Blastocatellia bacterium]
MKRQEHIVKRTIPELMLVPSEQRDLAWLQSSLASAIELELATLPPYLCAYWSIKDSTTTAATLINSIVLQEMLHMGLAANMLTTIGGTPAINANIPAYPGPLPGDVRPQLTVYLAGLSKDYLNDVCMQIEYPESGPIALFKGVSYPTIGAFYDAIRNAFLLVNPTFSGKNQLTAQVGSGKDNTVFPILSLADAEKAIQEIKEQGEGTSQSPDAVGFGGELAHYYKFAEIYNGAALVKVKGKWQYTGDPIPFPDVYPMGRVPSGGWANPPGNVSSLLQQVNSAYQTILDGLQAAWATGSQDQLNDAIGNMFSLSGPAIQLMQIPIGGGSSYNYGPDFIPS